jgi:hypothetical protein
MARDTAQGLKSLLLVMVVVGSVLSVTVAPAAAAAGNVTATSSSYTVEESGDQVTISFDVTADSSGISNGTAAFAVTQNGSAVYQSSKTIDVAANTTETVSFTFDPEAQDVSPGSYTANIDVGGVTASSDVTVENVPIEIGALGNATHTIGTSSEINVDVTNNGSTNQSNVTLVSTVLDADNNVVATYENTKNIDAGETATYAVTIPGDAINESGEYTIQHDVYVQNGQDPVATAPQNLDVASAGGGGAVLPDGGFSDDQLLIGAGILVVIGFLVAAAKAE